MGEIFTAAGSIAGAAISAKAVKDATAAQIKALEKQREFVFNELDPAKLQAATLTADRERMQNQLALQAITDPELLRQRYAAQAAISGQLEALTGGETDADLVAAQAAEEALAGGDVASQGKQALIDAALQELALGATLPPDVQAELVQSGLARSGRTTGGAGGQGFGGQILTSVLGSGGLALQKQRQDQAAGLLGQAQNLENSRASILGGLFPTLQQADVQKLGAAQNVLSGSAALVPEAGLSGEDVANIWLARVGATNKLAQQSADALGRQGTSLAGIYGAGIGGATAAIGGALPSVYTPGTPANSTTGTAATAAKWFGF